MSRRDFMKTLGLTGAGVSAASLVAPSFHDLDEASAEAKINPQPWWVKEVEKPTVEYDLTETDRYDFPERSTYYHEAKYITELDGKDGEAELERLQAKREEIENRWFTNNEPGKDHKGWALEQGATFGWSRDFPEYFLGDPFGPTPDAIGVSKWQGSPEEANRIVTAALKFYGASKVAFTKIFDDTYKNWFWDRGREADNPDFWKTGRTSNGFRNVRFEDVDKPYLTDDKKVIPNKFKNVIVFEIPQSDILTRLGPASKLEEGRMTAQVATAQAYSNLAITQRRFQRFMRALGYECLGGGTGSLAPVTPWAIISGLGEMSRMNPLLTNEWGTMIRSTVIFVTDMEIAPTNPIDAGMWRFCHACGLCAEACPYGALSLEKEPSWEPAGNYNAGGKKVFYIKYHNCYKHRVSAGGCDNCMCACPFSQQEHASIHDLVRGTAATTGVLNNFFVSLTGLFKYEDQGDGEYWWDLNAPFGGLDSTTGTAKLK
nr:reductive dehalogenase [uncultured bacterium]